MKQVQRTDPVANGFYQMGMGSLKCGNMEDAIAKFGLALMQNNRHTGAAVRLSEIYRDEKSPHYDIKKAITLLENANQEDVEVIFGLAELYIHTETTQPENQAKIVPLLNKAKEKGHPKAKQMLDCMHSLQRATKKAELHQKSMPSIYSPSGLSLSEEPMWELPAESLSSLFPGINVPMGELSDEDLKSKADNGDKEAQFQLFLKYKNGDKAAKAKANYYLASLAVQEYPFTSIHIKSNSEAQHIVGMMFLHGDGIKVNKSKAIEWFEKAAGLGHIEASYKLGMLYKNKNDAEHYNIEKATAHFQKAADAKHVEACYERAVLYFNEQNTIAELTNEVYRLLTFAKDHGHQEAAKIIDTLNQVENDSVNGKIDITPEMLEHWKAEQLETQDEADAGFIEAIESLKRRDKRSEEIERVGPEKYVSDHLVAMHRALAFHDGNGVKHECDNIRYLASEIMSKEDLQKIKTKIMAQKNSDTEYVAILDKCLEPFDEKLDNYTKKELEAKINHLEHFSTMIHEQTKVRDVQESAEKRKHEQEVADAAARAERERVRAQETADRIAQEKTQAAERAKQMKPKNDLLDLLRSINTVMATKCSEFEKYQKECGHCFKKDISANKCLKCLKKGILDNIESMSKKLKNTLEGNKNMNRESKLGANIISLNDLIKILSSINIEVALKKSRALSQFASKLQENLTEKETTTLEKAYPGFSKWQEALKGEVNEANTLVLNTAHTKLEARFKLIQQEQETLLAHMKALEALHQMVKKRKEEEVDKYRTTEKNEKFPLETQDRDKITALVAQTVEMIKNIGEGIPQPESTSIQTFATPASSERAAQPSRRERTTVTVHVQPEGGEAQSPKKKISKAERQRIFQQKWAKEIEDRRIHEEKAAFQDACARTAADIAAGRVPIPLRTPIEEPKVMLEYSVLLKMHLEQFSSIIQQLKGKLQNGQKWSIKEKFALLGSFAEVSELIMLETRDIAIKGVARRERNAIYKDPAVQEIDDLQLLDMSERWLTFLQTKVLGYFTDEAAVLRNIDSHPLLKGKKLIQPLYDLGKKLDIPLKGNSANRESQIADKVDVAKSKQCILSMRSYLIEHCEQNPGSEIIHTAALNFFWAILDATYVHLKAAKKAKMPEATAAFRELSSLTPYFSQIKDFTTIHAQGVLARHPATRLELINLLYGFEKADEKPLSTGAALDAELLFSQRASITQSLDSKTKAEAEYNPDLFKLLDSEQADYDIAYFRGLLATVDANVKDPKGRTLLLAACQNPNTPIEVIEILLQQDADPNAAIHYKHQIGERQPLFTDYTCVAFAALNDRADIIERLSENSKKPVTSLTWTQAKKLYSECKNENSDESAMKTLLEQKAAAKDEAMLQQASKKQG